MNFSGLPRLLLRHWYLTITGAVLTVALCALAASYVPAKHQAKADVLLLPAAKSVGVGGNPYLELGGLDQAADVLAKSLSDSSTTDALARAGISGTYAVVRDPTTSSPMLLVTGVDKSAAGAIRKMQQVVARIEPTMQKIQADISVAAAYQIKTKLVTEDTQALRIRKNQVRAVLGAGGTALMRWRTPFSAAARVRDLRCTSPPPRCGSA